MKQNKSKKREIEKHKEFTKSKKKNDIMLKLIYLRSTKNKEKNQILFISNIF